MAERLIIAGGGLSGVLTAVAFAQARPSLELTLLEGADSLGGNHTWSFFGSDVAGPAGALVEPFVTHRWSGYDVRFAKFERTFTTPYRSVTSETLDRVARAALGPRVRLSAPIAALDDGGATFTTGERLAADAVLDARGAATLSGVTLRWQKFLGREVRLARPHGLTRPTIMDARVSQVDGYRFVYLLPFSADTLLVEDTYYSEGRGIDADVLRARIDAYAAARGWTIVETIREEAGALPLLLAQDHAQMWADAAPPGAAVPLGLRAGLFHPVTGYSLPVAAHTAAALAGLTGPLTTDRLRAEVARIARRHSARSGFGRLLNRLLFLAGPPDNRHRVLARFHTLHQPLIERFYAGALTRADRVRILAGKPPVPILSALRALPEPRLKELVSASDRA